MRGYIMCTDIAGVVALCAVLVAVNWSVYLWSRI